MRTSRSWLPSYANRGISRRAFLRASAAGAGGAFLLACGGGDGGSAFKFDDAATSRQPGTVWRTENDYKLADETKEAVRGGIYRSLETADMSGHFDAIALMGSEIPFSYHMYEQLTQRNRRPGIDPASKEGYFAVPALAENWEFADAGLTVTFTLRKNVKFHNIAPVNGRAMDIDDWRTSTQRHQQIGVYRNFMNSVVDKVEYPDATHMVWRMKHPYAPLYEVLPIAEWGYPIQPKELNSDPDLARRVAVGTGFKILDKLQPSITHEYRKFSEYWGGDPFIERWHFPIIPEYSNRYAQFVSGNITNFTPTARDVLQVAKDVPGAVIVADPPDRRRASRYLFGIDRPANDPYNDPRVRIAMRRSVDFKSIGEFLSNKQAFDAAGIAIELTPMTHLPQNSAYWLNPEKGELGDLSKNYLFDQAEARKLLQAAGHTSPLLLNMANQTSGTNVLDPSALMVDNLKLAGIWNVNVIQNASAAAQNLYRIERTSDAIVWSSGSDSEPDYLIARDWSNTYRPDGRTAFQHAKTEDLLRLQREALDFGKRVEVLKDIQRWGAEWMMVVPAQHIFTTFSFRWPWVHNSNWGGEDGQPYWGGHYWWLDPAMPRREQGAA